jgi:hypothetical protein
LSIIDRYASAVRSSDLRSRPDTTFSDPDVIGAFGLAGKREPLGAALMRLFTGDNNAAQAVIEALTQKLLTHFPASLRESEARTVATGVLAWNRANVCTVCHGSGYEVIPGTPSLSDKECKSCRGTGKTLFHRQFHRSKLEYADWAQAQIEMAQSRAGQEAMRAIAPSLDL